MPNYFITGQGMLEQAAGDYIVPVGTTIYFFSPSDSLLETPFSLFFMDHLCNRLIDSKAESYIRALSIEVAPEGERVPNYLAVGTDCDLRGPTGIYQVGQPRSNGPFVRLLPGVRKTLKDLVSGIGEGGAIGTHIYWGVSRRDAQNSVGFPRRQYSNPVPLKSSKCSKRGRKPPLRTAQHDEYPLGSASFKLERFGGPVDYIDFPQFREFKARLNASQGAFA